MAFLLNSLEFVNHLRQSDFSEEQASGLARALTVAMTDSLATKQDLRELESRIEARFVGHDARFDATDARIDALEMHVDRRFDEQEQRTALRFEEFEKRWDAKLEARLAATEAKFEARFASLETRVDTRHRARPSQLRRDERLLVWTLVAALAAPVTACTDRPAASQRGPERVDLNVVPLPSTVQSVRFPWYARDGSAILFSGQPQPGKRTELLAIAEDGSDLRCLTCGIAPAVEAGLLKPLPFSDGRRVLLRVGEQSPLRAAAHAVLECRPSVAECVSAELLPIDVPADEAADVIQNQREFRPSPDGRLVGFTQVRASPTGSAVLVAVVARLERVEQTYALRQARVVSTLGELKGFTPDASAALVAAFTTSPYETANPDVVRIDLATGEATRVTSFPDYDEPLEFSPDGSWYVVGSGRGAGLFETVWQPKRPNFIGNGLEPLAAALFVAERSRLLQPWLVRAGNESIDMPGQSLNPGSVVDGFSGRPIANWHPDGTRVVFSESNSDPFQPPTSAARLVVARLVERPPTPARPQPTTPEPTWAPLLAGFVPDDPPDPRSRPGLRAGAVEITTSQASGESRRLAVVYRGFSDDGDATLDGYEEAEYSGGLVGYTRYRADLRVSGRSSGFLRADAGISAGGIDGFIESEVDGRYLRLPPPLP